MSSLGGQMRNPHALDRTPSSSSGGSGIAVAANYAVLAMGSDTGGSVRNPAAATGVVGLKPTHGLLGRDGIIPLALTYDVPGPLARHVTDVAVTLGLLVGVDPADVATQTSVGHSETDYTRHFQRIAEGLAELPEDVLLDGEAVAFHPYGHSNFKALRGRGARDAVLVALEVEGCDLPEELSYSPLVGQFPG